MGNFGTHFPKSQHFLKKWISGGSSGRITHIKMIVYWASLYEVLTFFCQCSSVFTSQTPLFWPKNHFPILPWEKWSIKDFVFSWQIWYLWGTYIIFVSAKNDFFGKNWHQKGRYFDRFWSFCPAVPKPIFLTKKYE